jgi:RNA polymerase sigma factor (sigma-70 family)
MSAREYTESEIEYIVRAFKVYVKKVVKHSAIDFVRKVDGGAVKEIAFTDFVDRNVSLSLYDSDSFFAYKDLKISEIEKLEDIATNRKLKLAIHNLTKDEKKILALSIDEYSSKEIAKEMNLTEKTIRNKKSIIKSKIKKMLGE